MSNRPDLINVNSALLAATETYRGLFFDMQQRYWDESKKVNQLTKTAARQRAVIADLERRLGVDQEL